ncbi:MAG: GIY-YIG nuclease family protein [Gemmatimonadota bacterium]
MSHRIYAVYILASRSRVLYVGSTSDLIRRIHQHRTRAAKGFTQKYGADRLVYFEQTPNSRAAVEREREIKGWRREKKVRLIESVNPGWLDLAEDWFEGPVSSRASPRRGDEHRVCHPERAPAGGDEGSAYRSPGLAE